MFHMLVIITIILGQHNTRQKDTRTVDTLQKHIKVNILTVNCLSINTRLYILGLFLPADKPQEAHRQQNTTPKVLSNHLTGITL